MRIPGKKKPTQRVKNLFSFQGEFLICNYNKKFGGEGSGVSNICVSIIYRYKPTHIQHAFLREAIKNLNLEQCSYLDIWVDVSSQIPFYHTLNENQVNMFMALFGRFVHCLCSVNVFLLNCWRLIIHLTWLPGGRGTWWSSRETEEHSQDSSSVPSTRFNGYGFGCSLKKKTHFNSPNWHDTAILLFSCLSFSQPECIFLMLGDTPCKIFK